MQASINADVPKYRVPNVDSMGFCKHLCFEAVGLGARSGVCIERHIIPSCQKTSRGVAEPATGLRFIPNRHMPLQ